MTFELAIPQAEIDRMAHIGAMAIFECQRRGHGFNELVHLLRAYRYAMNTRDMGGTLDVSSVCFMGIMVSGLPDETPIPILIRGCPGGTAAYLLRRVADGLQQPTDRAIARFMEIAPFATGNARTAWIMQNWMDETLDDPTQLRYA